ncbi:MAG: hypothetical protein ABSC25_15020 [Roseiarcus sp.]
MIDAASVVSSLIGCFDAGRFGAEPYRHWLLENILPADACAGVDAWRGFRRRPVDGVRRSLIINDVKPEWRSRHELAFPDRFAGA